jgi:hypothetical protein
VIYIALKISFINFNYYSSQTFLASLQFNVFWCSLQVSAANSDGSLTVELIRVSPEEQAMEIGTAITYKVGFLLVYQTYVCVTLCA